MQTLNSKHDISFTILLDICNYTNHLVLLVLRYFTQKKGLGIDTSLAKGGYVFGSIGLSVCLSDCGQHYSKSYEWMG